MTAKYISLKLLILLCVFSGFTRTMAQSPKTDSTGTLHLAGYEVHFVKAKNIYQYRTDKNELRKADAAYLVLLNLQSLPPVTNTRINFYIGDYKIPEYGGTKKGIYFRIYDPVLLTKLNNQPISWQRGNDSINVFDNTRFQVDTKKLKPEREEILLGKKQ